MSHGATGTDCETIVVGTGGVGAAALYELARRGRDVVGLDRFAAGHDRGSSHGHTRMIRLAYFEHPDYVPLLRRAFDLWEELQAERQARLYFQTGLLQVGPRDGEVVRGVLQSARRHGLEVEELSASQVRERHRGFALDDDHVGVVERRAGYLLVEDCVRAHLAGAVAAGAEHHVDQTVRSIEASRGEVVVKTDTETFRARHAIITAGAWARQLLPELSQHLEVLRKPLFWYGGASADYAFHPATGEGCPAFFFETLGRFYYGFPQFDGSGVKMAEHSRGEVVTDPLHVDRTLRQDDRDAIEAFIERHLPGVPTELVDHRVCLYTVTPDGHFVVDRHPQHPSILFAAGLSGHGYKFAPVLGEALADLVCEGETKLPIGFLGLERFGR